MPRQYSVVITSYDRAELLFQAIESVEAQTLAPLEVIVVLDGSPTDTARELRHNYPDVRLIVQEANLGRSVAANIGAFAAKGGWLCLLDDDDMWHPDKLRIVDQYLTDHPQCQALRHYFWYFAASTTWTTDSRQIDIQASSLEECLLRSSINRPVTDFAYLNILGDSFERMLERNCGAYSETVLTRELYFRGGGLPPAQASTGDWILFLNVARLTEWHTLPEPLAFQRVHANQMTADTRNAIYILASKISIWLSDRPLPQALDEEDARVRLARYGREYRKEIREFFWGAIQERRGHSAATIALLGTVLLPRWRDRVGLLVPPGRSIPDPMTRGLRPIRNFFSQLLSRRG